MATKQNPKFSREQRANLEARINSVTSYHFAGVVADKKIGDEPASIKAARALVGRYDERREKKAREIRNQIHAEGKKAREVLLFGTPEQALAAVTTLEKKYRGIRG